MEAWLHAFLISALSDVCCRIQPQVNKYDIRIDVMKNSVFCLPPTCCLAYFSILRMEVICSAETSVAFQQTIRRSILGRKIGGSGSRLRPCHGGWLSVPVWSLHWHLWVCATVQRVTSRRSLVCSTLRNKMRIWQLCNDDRLFFRITTVSVGQKLPTFQGPSLSILNDIWPTDKAAGPRKCYHRVALKAKF